MSCCLAGLALLGGHRLGKRLSHGLLAVFVAAEAAAGTVAVYNHREHIAEAGRSAWRQIGATMGTTGSGNSASFERIVCRSK
ncbi:hypothetical protein ACO0LO_05470 [Undibacterium sp. TJN25]|uniref:hypothetical protein n=1 Tax=Undibacterium sp. TJN25 TaxID=3413056 RepID=UPI003BF31542